MILNQEWRKVSTKKSSQVSFGKSQGSKNHTNVLTLPAYLLLAGHQVQSFQCQQLPHYHVQKKEHNITQTHVIQYVLTNKDTGI